MALPEDAPNPKVLACYGLLVRHRPPRAEQMWLWFVDRRPVSTVIIEVLTWCSPRRTVQGITALLLIWDNAP
jgi:cytochrome c-type biogenesis protein CcmH/NrfF